MGTTCFTYSAGTSYSGGTASISVTLPASKRSYCLTATSQSGAVFRHSNTGGGFTTTPC